MKSESQTTEEALAKAIADAEADVRRVAKRDGIPTDWIEATLAKLRGEKVGRA